MNKYLPIFLMLTACGIQPYDEKGNEITARQVTSFSEFNHQIAGRNVHGVRTGDNNNPAILFIHGAPSDWRAWGLHLADKDLLKNYQIIAIDRTGYNGSEKGNWEGSLKLQTKTVMQASLKEHEGPFLIIGHSFGGPVAVQAAIDYPDNVSGIIVLAGALDPDLEETKWFQYIAGFPLLRWLVPSHLDVANQEILALKGELNKQQKQLKNINKPVLIIQGKDDTLVPEGNADYAQEQLFNADLEIIRIPNRGHFLPWEEFDLLKQKILQYQKILQD